jgi:tetratricopeptide (TPR) repeat protein
MEEDLRLLLKEDDLPEELANKIGDQLFLEFTPQQLRTLVERLDKPERKDELSIHFHTLMFRHIKEHIGEYAAVQLRKSDRRLGCVAARHAVYLKDVAAELGWFNRISRLYKKGTRKESMPIFEQLVPVLKNLLPSYYQEFIYFLQRYVDVLRFQKRYDDTLAALQMIYELEVKVAGEWHADSMDTLEQMILTNRDAGYYKAERLVIDRQIEIMTDAFIRTDWDKLVDVIGAKAETYANEQQMQNAAQVFQHWLNFYTQKFSQDHSLLCSLLIRASDLFHRFEQPDLAEEYAQRAIHICKRRIHQITPRDSFRLKCWLEEMYMLAKVYRLRGEHEAALETYFEVVAKCEEHFGVRHYETIRANHELVRHMDETNNDNYLSVLLLMQEYMDAHSRPYSDFFADVNKRLLEYYRKNHVDHLLFETYEKMIFADVERCAWRGEPIQLETLASFVQDTIHKQHHVESLAILKNAIAHANRLKIDQQCQADLMYHELQIIILYKPKRQSLIRLKIIRIWKIYRFDITRNRNRIINLKKWREQF